jgi:drug/metabolite transporter (DMT)-like permease
MQAIAGGLGAALVFATVTLCNSRSSRMIGAGPLLAWVMLIGLAITGPGVLIEGVPDGLDGESTMWLAVAGVGNVVGLLLAYAALRTGKVGIVAPLVSTQGAVAAVIAVIAGESISPGAGVALGAIACGVFLAGVTREEETEGEEAGEGHTARATLYALGAAVAIGWSLYATARASIELPVVWALLPSRLIGVAAVTIPLVLRSEMRMTREAIPLVAVAGICEVLGFALFAWGARDGIAVAAVLSSQFAAIAAVAAYVLFRERLARPQLVGVAVVIAGVGVLSGIQA